MQHEAQIIIVGGGIAGAWTQRILLDHGYDSILLESEDLGQIQTLGSQGMIHGGQRYHLQGTTSDHGDKIAMMPKVWNDCLRGVGDVDLSQTKVLAENQYMWSPGGLASNVAAFMASKAMNSKVKSLDHKNLPEVFKKSPKFKGSVYEMDESVIDIRTLMQCLVNKDQQRFLRFRVEQIQKNSQGYLLSGDSEGQSCEIACKLVIFAAGTGNEIPVRDLHLDKERPLTQRRPLKQMMIRNMEDTLYAHCITTDPRPRVTVTAHPMDDGSFVWYLGGIVAEYGIDKSDEEAIAFAKKEMKDLFPWIDWSTKEWACFYVDRAEPYFDKSFFKAGPDIFTKDQLALAWPTKLTFAPALAKELLEWVNQLNLDKSPPQPHKLPMKTCAVGNYPWEGITWHP